MFFFFFFPFVKIELKQMDPNGKGEDKREWGTVPQQKAYSGCQQWKVLEQP